MKSAVNNSRFLLKSLHDNILPEAFNSKPADVVNVSAKGKV